MGCRVNGWGCRGRAAGGFCGVCGVVRGWPATGDIAARKVVPLAVIGAITKSPGVVPLGIWSRARSGGNRAGWRSNRHTAYRYRMGFHCPPGGNGKPAPAFRTRGLCMVVWYRGQSARCSCLFRRHFSHRAAAKVRHAALLSPPCTSRNPADCHRAARCGLSPRAATPARPRRNRYSPVRYPAKDFRA